MVQLTESTETSARRPLVETIGASLVLQVVVMVSGVLAARMLGPFDRGNLALFWTLAVVITQLAMMGLPLAVTYEMAYRRVRIQSIWTVLRSRVLVLGVVAILVQCLAIVLIFGHREGAVGAGLVSLVSIPAIFAQSFSVAALQGEQRFAAMNVARIAPFAGYSLALLIGLLLGADSLLFVTSAWAVTYLLGSLVAVGLVRSGPEPATGPAPDRDGMIRFGLKGLLGAMSPTETFRADQLLVGLVLSPAALGLYVAALALTNLPRFLALSVGMVAYPRIAQSPPEERRPLIWRYCWLSVLIAVGVALPISLLAAPVLGFFFGGEFRPAATAVQILLAGSVLLAARRVLGDGLRGADHPEASTIAEIVAWVWLVPALVVAAIAGTIEAVAIALASAYVVSWIAIVYLAWREGLGPLGQVSER